MKDGRQEGHPLSGPHRDFTGEWPAGFVALRLYLEPEGPSFELRRPMVLVGRHSRADLRLAVADVSRRHCRLFFHEGFWHVRDLRSVNGIHINQRRVPEGTLYDGDLLSVGGLLFRVDYPASSSGALAEVIRQIAQVLPPKAS